jgi:hypothetical protein
MKHSYTITFPDGTTKTDNSKRIYTHYVAGRKTDSQYSTIANWGGRHHTSSLALANKIAARMRNKGYEVVIGEFPTKA